MRLVKSAKTVPGQTILIWESIVAKRHVRIDENIC